MRVHVLNVGLLENATIGKFFLTTLLAVDEIERTQEGKAIARPNGDFREGRANKYNQK